MMQNSNIFLIKSVLLNQRKKIAEIVNDNINNVICFNSGASEPSPKDVLKIEKSVNNAINTLQFASSLKIISDLELKNTIDNLRKFMLNESSVFVIAFDDEYINNMESDMSVPEFMCFQKLLLEKLLNNMLLSLEECCNNNDLMNDRTKFTSQTIMHIVDLGVDFGLISKKDTISIAEILRTTIKNKKITKKIRLIN